MDWCATYQRLFGRQLGRCLRAQHGLLNQSHTASRQAYKQFQSDEFSFLFWSFILQKDAMYCFSITWGYTCASWVCVSTCWSLHSEFYICVTFFQNFRQELKATGLPNEIGAFSHLVAHGVLVIILLRWDGSQPELFEGQYGVYLMKKVGSVSWLESVL